MSQNIHVTKCSTSCMRQNSLEIPQAHSVSQQVLMSVNEKLLTGLKVNPVETDELCKMSNLLTRA